jgi:hypothetical protein
MESRGKSGTCQTAAIKNSRREKKVSPSKKRITNGANDDDEKNE